MRPFSIVSLFALTCVATGVRADDARDADFYESKIRPLLVKHCYECHSEAAQTAEAGLLLDRRAGWLAGGDSGKAVVPGEPDASLLVEAVRQTGELEMPPETMLAASDIELLEEWIRRGAPGPRNDLGATEFSRLGDQTYLFEAAQTHWAFQPVRMVDPPLAADPVWNQTAIDRFISAALRDRGLSPSRPADARTLARRLSFDLTGLPPTAASVEAFAAAAAIDRAAAVQARVDELINSPAFGEHVGRMWLDVARYADTDSFYRPDTRTPHYFPFAFTYRDYVIDAYNTDRPFDRFVQEQLAADLMGSPDLAALGFLAVGPYANRAPQEALDDWIDVTTRGLMGLTAACARCHDHKYEPIPTADYYSLRGIFASITRPDPLDEKRLPGVPGYEPSDADRADYEAKRAAIDAKIDGAGNTKAKNNNRPIALKIRQTELAELLLEHPGGPAHAMVVVERPRPVPQPIYVRGDPTNPGTSVPRRFLKVLDREQPPFSKDSSGRLELAEKITDPGNPLTARVYVNRVWGLVTGGYLVDTPSDFGLQSSAPSHPELLDWLAQDFMNHGWSTKRLVRQIVSSQTYQQASDFRDEMAAIDPQNRWLWRANRKHLSIEAIRDSLLAVSGKLDRTPRGRAGRLWGKDYTRRRTVYGYINRFNLDPTLRAFDFPTPMQTQPGRGESVVAPQALFTMNSPFVFDQAMAIADSEAMARCADDGERIGRLFSMIYQRGATVAEVKRVEKFLQQHEEKYSAGSRVVSGWALVAQALMMGNEFQYVD